MSLNFEQINGIVAELATLPYYRSEEAAHLAVVRIVGQMATNVDQVRWLVSRMTSGIYTEWPGPGELRACFCSKFKPADGIECHSSVYPDGIPSERTSQPWIAAAPPKLLEAGKDEPITDPRSQHGVDLLVRKSPRMPSGKPIGDEAEARFEEAISAPGDRRVVRGEARAEARFRLAITQPQERPVAVDPVSVARRLEIQAEIDRIVEERKKEREREQAAEDAEGGYCGAD